MNLIDWFCKIQRAVHAVATIRNWPDIYRAVRRGKGPLTMLSRRDGTIIHASDTAGLWCYYHDIWMRRVYTSMYKIPDGGTVVDVGANIGLFTLLAARRAGQVFSYEPDPRTFRYLSKNILDNGLENVRCFNYAIAAQSGEMVLQQSKSPAQSSLYARDFQGFSDSVKCRVMTLTQVMDDHKLHRIDFLKLDCEGCEFEVVLDMPVDYLSRIEIIAAEFHDHLSKHAHNELVHHLEAAGFSTDISNERGPMGILIARRK